MPHLNRVRVAIAGLLIAIAIAGLRILGPPGHWAWPTSKVLLVGGALELALAALLTGLHWRRGRPAARPGDDLPGKLRQLLTAALVACLIVVALLVLVSEARLTPNRPTQSEPVRLRGRLHRLPAERTHHGSSFTLPPLRDVFIAILIAALIVIGLAAWRHRRRGTRLWAGAGPDEVSDLSEDELAKAVESGRSALREYTDARLAIIRCYLAMEASLAEAGAERAAAETPDELLARAVAAELVSQPPAGRLTALFYEARFSSHELPDSARAEADRALTELAAELPVHASRPAQASR
jgi:uncharacterized protein DUF4129